MQLGEAVHRALEQVGARMQEAIPARVVLGVAQPEVGPEIDDRGPGADEVADHPRRRPVGEGQEDRIDVGERAVDRVAGRGEMRVDATERVGVAIAALEPDERDVRVAHEEPDQLGADVPRRADDADADPSLVAVALGAALRACHEWLQVSRHRMTIQRSCIVMQPCRRQAGSPTCRRSAPRRVGRRIDDPRVQMRVTRSGTHQRRK